MTYSSVRLCIPILTASLLGCAGSTNSDHPKAGTKEDTAKESAKVLESAKSFGESFLRLLERGDGASAYALLSKNFQERLPDEEKNSKSFNVNLVAGRPPTGGSVNERTNDGFNDRFDVSTSGNRVTLPGAIRRGQGGDKDLQVRRFTMIVVKEGGDWRVDVFSVEKK